MRKLIVTTLVMFSCVAPSQAGPKKVLQKITDPFVQNFYRDFRGPYKWSHTINMALVVGASMADAASSCVANGKEVGGARFFIGSHPSCHQQVLLQIGAIVVETTPVNWFAHKFEDSCKKEAADPNSKWWHTDSHTKSTAGCFWGVEAANSIAVGVYKYPVVRSNVSLAERE